MEDKCWNSSSEGKRHFLATCERTKHTKITTVAAQGLDNTCANCPECQINKQDLIYYEDPSAICCKIKTRYEAVVVRERESEREISNFIRNCYVSPPPKKNKSKPSSGNTYMITQCAHTKWYSRHDEWLSAISRITINNSWRELY